MKTMIFIVAIILGLACQTQAQAQDYETRLFQGNTLCPMVITVTAGELSAPPVRVFLSWGETVLQSGDLYSGDSMDLTLPPFAEWYTLNVGRGAGPYEITSGLACGGEDEPPDPVVDLDALREHFDPLFKAIRAILKK